MTKQIFSLVLGTLLVNAWGLANAQNAPIAVPVSDTAVVGEVIVQDVAVGNAAEPKLQVNSSEDADYFALSIPPIMEKQAASVDLVILCDTSASMNGSFRDDQVMAVSTLLESLSPADRVSIFAVDTQAVRLTNAFSAPGTEDVAQAVAKLQNYTPLGAVDLERVLTAASGSFDTTADSERVIVFIGQGRSRAKLMSLESFTKVADQFAKDRISVHSVAVGPDVDMVVLKTLAAKTGGNVVTTGDSSFAELPAMIRRKVGWVMGDPEHNFDSLYPKTVPPMRSDRESIMIGKAKKGMTAASIKFTVSDGTEVNVEFAPETIPGTSIADMVQDVEKSSRWLPLEKWSDVENVMFNVNQNVDFMLAAASELLKTLEESDMNSMSDEQRKAFEENMKNAVQMVEKAKVLAPNHPNVQYISGLCEQVAEKLEGGEITYQDAGPSLVDEGRAEDVNTQRQRIMVQEAISSARQMMSDNPDSAIEILMVQLATIESVGLPAEAQDTLTKQIQSSIREAKARKEEQSIKKAEDRARLTEMRERQIALDNAKTDEENMKKMMRRFDALMEEGKYRQAEESAAAAVLEKDPENIAAIAGTVTARHRGYVERNRQITVLRQKGFVDALHQAEIGNIPFPDDPPIVYPDSEVWKRLTERRVAKYSSMDLAQRSPVEKQLMEAVKESTQISEVETPLPEVIEKLKEQHNIEIQLDVAALEEEGLDSELPITLDVHGISLGAALRLMLSSNGMMFVVEDEVLKITTQSRAEESQSTRVYPVA
ncbi:MAG: VWA domain-containing protein, partial [Thermoguttaceae bacterium]|nr:VWA domain-containing protein [Thermoguttaceae bacterium]